MSYLKYDGSLAVETPTPVTNQFGSSAGAETLTGRAGADGLTAGGPNDLLIGNGGGDTFTIQGANFRLQESPGGIPNQINAWQNIDLANYANIQNLNVGGSNDYAAGDGQDNIIYATGSHQQLYGGAGQDVLVGNGQSDTFIVVKGEGNDAIYGFNAATDVVRLSGGYSSFAQLQQHMTQVGSDVNIDLGGGSAVVIRNVATSQLTAANFQLQLDTSKLGALTFGDEFNSLSLWNGSSGTWATTFWYQDPNGNGGTIASNGEQEWYINANYAGTSSVTPWTVGGGNLTLTAAPASPAIQSLISGYQYTSGEVNTFHSFAQTYGYFEMRAELPHNAGGWPAFWLMPTDGSWPPELDVMETLTNDPHADYTTSHSSVGGNTMNQGVAFVPDTSDGFHTYGVLWTKTDLVWYVDGAEVFHTATPSDMNKPMYMIANLALGGWGGNVDPAQTPAHLNIDYIHAYALADGSSSVALNNVGGGSVSTDTSTGATTSGGTTTSGTATGGTTTGGTTTGGTTTGGTTTGGTTPSGGGTSTPSDAPTVYTSPGPGSVEVGGAGHDTFYASQGADTLTGGGGANVFAFKAEPWSPDHITDFHVGVDKLDLSALFQKAGYSGSDPVADQYIVLASDGNGGTIVRFDHDGTGSNPVWPNTIIDLEGVSPVGLSWSQLTGDAGAGAGTSTGGTTTGGTTTGGTTSVGTTSGGTTSGGVTGGGGGGGGGVIVAGQNLTAPSGGGAVIGGDGADTLAGQDGSNQLYGRGGNDLITGGTGYNDVNGNLGDDTLIGRSLVGDRLFGGQGQDSIDATASTGHNLINGNRGDDVIHGGSGGDSLYGGQGDDFIVGGRGADWLSGDLGTNTLTGGQGADTFHGVAGGTSHITDFNGLEGDRIQLDANVPYHLAQQSDGLHLVFDTSQGGELILDGVSQQSFQTGWIV